MKAKPGGIGHVPKLPKYGHSTPPGFALAQACMATNLVAASRCLV